MAAKVKWGYQWIRWMTRIELSVDPEYRWYRESRGYNDRVDLNRPFFDD